MTLGPPRTTTRFEHNAAGRARGARAVPRDTPVSAK